LAHNKSSNPMSAATYNLAIEAGTTYRRTLRFFTDTARTVPVDLTGCEIAAWMTRNARKVEFAVEITDAENGTATIYLAPAQTIDIPPSAYAWDMLLRDPSGDIAKTFKGIVAVSPTQTQLP
jgi:hypothetical protein